MTDEQNIPSTETPRGPSPVPRNLGSRALSGVTWNSVSVGVVTLGQVGYTVIMSRLVSPEAFGLVAMSALARGIGTLLSPIGIRQALVQKPTLTTRETRAGFAMSVALGLGLFGLSWMLSPALADLFDEARATSVIRGASLIFITLGLSATSEALLQRDLRFRELALIHIGSFFVGHFMVGVAAALAGAGVWALVIAPIASAFLGAILTYARVRHPIRPTFDGGSYRALFSFGSRASLIQLGEFFGNQTDTIVVARYEGAALLGKYNRAFYLAVLPLQKILNTMVQTLFSVFSRLQRDLPRLKRAFLSSLRVSAGIFLPVSAAIGVASYELVVVLLGERYAEAAPLIPFFAIYAAMSRVSLISGILCAALAELNKRLVLQAVYVAGLAGALLAVAGGPLWVYGAVLAVGEVARNLAYSVFIVRKVIPIGLAELIKANMTALGAAAIMVVSVFATRALTIGVFGTKPIVTLVAEGTTAALTFIALVRWGPLSFLRNEIVSRIPLDRTDSRSIRMLAFALKMALGVPRVTVRVPGSDGGPT